MTCSGIQINDGANGSRKMERRGLTLLELVVGPAIVVATASVAVLSSGAAAPGLPRRRHSAKPERAPRRDCTDLLAGQFFDPAAAEHGCDRYTVSQPPKTPQLRYLFVNPADGRHDRHV